MDAATIPPINDSLRFGWVGHKPLYVVPANAGTHTARSRVFTLRQTPSARSNARG
jgi:hypothetical protein